MDAASFLREIHEFRQAMGTRSFWTRDVRHRDGAVRGLTQA